MQHPRKATKQDKRVPRNATNVELMKDSTNHGILDTPTFIGKKAKENIRNYASSQLDRTPRKAADAGKNSEAEGPEEE